MMSGKKNVFGLSKAMKDIEDVQNITMGDSGTLLVFQMWSISAFVPVDFEPATFNRHFSAYAWNDNKFYPFRRCTLADFDKIGAADFFKKQQKYKFEKSLICVD